MPTSTAPSQIHLTNEPQSMKSRSKNVTVTFSDEIITYHFQPLVDQTQLNHEDHKFHSKVEDIPDIQVWDIDDSEILMQVVNSFPFVLS